jgi:hypothetical protein
MQNLDREECGTEGGSENSRDARGQASDEQYSTLPFLDAQVASDDRSQRATDLHRGTLAPARTAKAEREEGRQRFGQRHPTPDDAAVFVEGADNRIRPTAPGLRREPGR